MSLNGKSQVNILENKKFMTDRGTVGQMEMIYFYQLAKYIVIIDDSDEYIDDSFNLLQTSGHN